MTKAARVAVVGAGFSGLSLALRLKQQGLEVSVFESKGHVGGLIQTQTEPVMVESAAHAFLASLEVEELFQELGVPWVQAGHRSKSKWIFRGRPRKWPLTVNETLGFLKSLILAKLTRSFGPRPHESLAQWADRNSFSSLKLWLLGPALQGVYGTNPESLSASLVLGGILNPALRLRKGKLRGSVAPLQGMQALLMALAEALEKRGGVVHLNSSVNLSELQKSFDTVILATSATSAAQLLSVSAPRLSAELQKIPQVSLVTTTIAVSSVVGRVQGFGCLFPRSEGFQALGVLFNTDLFENRGALDSETWIFPKETLACTDSEILSRIQVERSKLGPTAEEFAFAKIIRWPEVLPLYGSQLENLLRSDLFETSKETSSTLGCLQAFHLGARVAESSAPLYLSGNYLGGIGLTKILSYNNRLAKKIRQDLEWIKGPL
jgi:oxygen-dependent protoporphyrinogen oxidase